MRRQVVGSFAPFGPHLVEVTVAAPNRISYAMVAFALVLLPAPVLGQTLSKVQVAKIGKAATALVEVQAGKGSGSAFCVHPSGLYVTNDHVVRGASGAVTLVLNSGQKSQKVVKARVVRTDGLLDLALLRVEGEGNHPALALGSDADLTELTEVVAFGFPFGKDLSFEKEASPAVSVNAGTVASLRSKGGELNRVQMDAGVNPGCSGGPVLDMSGKVVGVVA
jgi:S1-C subfamily serine protease